MRVFFVIAHVFTKKSPQMSLMERNPMIEEIAPATSNSSLRTAVRGIDGSELWRILAQCQMRCRVLQHSTSEFWRGTPRRPTFASYLSAYLFYRYSNHP